MTRRKLFIGMGLVFGTVFLIATVSVFFDQAVLVRKNTFYRANTTEKIVALTFDDGPSPKWTPRILAELKRAGVKATFFMIGQHVEKYPDIARQVVAEGHEIANHGYDHKVIMFSRFETLRDQLTRAQDVIQKVTGQTTTLFRPPKAWISDEFKLKVRAMGYEVVLWSLNSKDWVSFNDRYIIRYIVKNIRPGDIILFHDSGAVFGTEGESRKQTARTIYRLVEKLRERGYECVTVSELLKREGKK